MQSRRRTLHYRRSLRARRFRRSRRGVVSVVGTLLSLLVFFALFGVFLTQYLPVWMTQNESAFTYQAQASMETFKQYADDQAILGGPQTYVVPFTMNSQGVALFAQPTQGTLSFLTNRCPGGFTSNPDPAFGPANSAACAYQHLAFWSTISNTVKNYVFVNQPLALTSVTNALVFQLPNRYYPSEKLTFDNNAVFGAQAGSAPWMVVAPPVNVSDLGHNLTLTTSFLTLGGSSYAFASSGTKAVYSTLLGNGTLSSAGRFVLVNNTTKAPVAPVLFNVAFDVGTANVCAWYNFLHSVLDSANNSSGTGLVPLQLKAPPASPTSPGAPAAYLTVNGATFSPGSPTSPQCLNLAGTTFSVQMVLYNVNFASLYTGNVGVSFSTGGL